MYAGIAYLSVCIAEISVWVANQTRNEVEKRKLELGRLLETGDRAVCEPEARRVRVCRQDRVRGGHQVVF